MPKLTKQRWSELHEGINLRCRKAVNKMGKNHSNNERCRVPLSAPSTQQELSRVKGQTPQERRTFSLEELSCSSLTPRLSWERARVELSSPSIRGEVRRPGGRQPSQPSGAPAPLSPRPGLTTSAQHSNLFIVVPGNLRRSEAAAAAAGRALQWMAATPQPVQSSRYI